MWCIILGIYLVISGFFALIFWFALIAAKRSDERNTPDLPENKKDT
jgi:hypothetical protein